MTQHMREYSNIDECFPIVQEEYWKSMNSIIIKKHLKESRHDIVPCDLIVVFNRKKNVAPDFGLIPVNRETEIVVEDGVKKVVKGATFLENFKKHCENSLRTKKSIIVSLQMIKI